MARRATVPAFAALLALLPGCSGLVRSCVESRKNSRAKEASSEAGIVAVAERADAAPVSAPPRSRLVLLEAGSERPLPFAAGAGGAVIVAERRPGAIGEITSVTFETSEVRLRGSLGLPKTSDIAGSEYGTFRIHEAKHAVLLGDSPWILVLASTGLWLHESTSLAKRARLRPAPIIDIAAAPDGRAFAAVTCPPLGSACTLEVVRFPELTTESKSTIDSPLRVRFSPDSKKVVSASYHENSFTVLDRATRKLFRVGQKSAVNDAVVLPRSDQTTLVAFADDGDDAQVFDAVKKWGLFSSARFVESAHEVKSGIFRGLVWGRRDMNAVAYDPATETLFAGGDDNRVWRFEKIFTPAETTGASSEPFKGNVTEMFWSAPHLFVAFDSGLVQRLDSKGASTAALDAHTFNVFSEKIRIAPSDAGHVLVARDDVAGIWDPGGESRLFTDYRRGPASGASITGRDVVFARWVPVAEGGQVRVERVTFTPKGKVVPDVEAELVAARPLVRAPTGLLALASGERVLLGTTDGSTLAFARLAAGGELSAFVPTDIPSDGSSGAPDPPGHRIAYLDPRGVLWELTDETYMFVSRGQTRQPTKENSSVSWDEARHLWTVKRGNDPDVDEIPGGPGSRP